jgi:hypothetical protein
VNIKRGLFGREDQWEKWGGMKRVMGKGEYDQSTLHTCMKISQWKLLFYTVKIHEIIFRKFDMPENILLSRKYTFSFGGFFVMIFETMCHYVV